MPGPARAAGQPVAHLAGAPSFELRTRGRGRSASSSVGYDRACRRRSGAVPRASWRDRGGRHARRAAGHGGGLAGTAFEIEVDLVLLAMGFSAGGQRLRGGARPRARPPGQRRCRTSTSRRQPGRVRLRRHGAGPEPDRLGDSRGRSLRCGRRRPVPDRSRPPSRTRRARSARSQMRAPSLRGHQGVPAGAQGRRARTSLWRL